MSVFDDLDEKARELAAKAKAALENPDDFFAKARERVEEAVTEAKEDIEEFAHDARGEFKGIRQRVAELLDCEPAGDAAKAEPAAPAESTDAKEPPAPTPPGAG